MRVGECHHHGEAFVRGADHADLAVGLLDVLDQPIDGVPRIGGMVDLAGIERPAQRPGHHVIAFRTVLAAHVLDHADVATFHEHIVALREQVLHVRRRHALGASAGVVRRAREHHRCIACALGQHDHRMQLDPIAHRDHHFTLDVVVGSVACHERLAGDVRGHRRGLRQRRAGGGGNGGSEQAGGKTTHRRLRKLGGKSSTVGSAAPPGGVSKVVVAVMRLFGDWAAQLAACARCAFAFAFA